MGKAQLLAKINSLCPGRFGEGLANRSEDNLQAIYNELMDQKVVFEGGPHDKRVEYQHGSVVEREVPDKDGKLHKYVRDGKKFVPSATLP